MSGADPTPEIPKDEEGMDVDSQSEASDMEEVLDMETLKELEEQGMVQIAHEGGEETPVSDDDDVEGDDANMEEEEEEGVPDMAAAVLKKHTEAVHAVALHPSLPLVASGGEDDKAFLWKVDPSNPGPTDVEPLFELTGHTDTVICVAFSFDGSILATGGMDGRVMLWNPTDGSLISTLEDLGDAVTYLFWHPKGRVLFAGSADSQSVMWSDKGVVLQVFAGHASEVTCGALVSDNKLLATGSEDQAVKVFSPKTSEMLAHFDIRAKGMHMLPDCGVTAVAGHPKNADVVIAGYESGSVAILGIAKKKVNSVVLMEHTMAVESIAVSPILPYFATCSAGDGTLSMWNAESNTVRDKIKQEAGFVSLKWAGEHLYSADTQGEIKRYEGRAMSTKPPHVWTGHSNTALCLATHEDGWVVSGSDDATLRMFTL
eukprot:TRINITY_DN8365_c1_g1_i1.p1 TRINITY_DN8365_c1_g1~~TRINITY_DN8365_c1_g1_i1.p1  ORF type:complete len:430 (+),score=146.58 TRINITY_DN8365_c1_g1_i1:64-1353(+)